jgi:hypothetical protein
MRRLLAAFVSLSFILSAHAETPFRGSTVIVPPLISRNTLVHPSPRIMRLPPQAGIVARVITTRLPNSAGKALIAKGDKYHSLCTPNQFMVACAPLVRNDIMRDIDVGAYVDKNNESLLTFRIKKETTRTPAELAYSISYFKSRFAKVGRHFDLLSDRYMPKPPRSGPPGMHPPVEPKFGSIKPATINTGAGYCTFDDFGAYDCSGGSSGEGGDGYDVDSYDWESNDDGGDQNDPLSIPDFPFGNDNGDSDPCIDSGGNNICQQVVITGQRADLGGCIFTPRGNICQTKPPPLPLDPYETLPPTPSGRKPWFAQSTCNNIHVLCTEGQVPDDRAPTGDHEALLEWTQDCLDRAQNHLNMCKVLAIFNSAEWLNDCTNTATSAARHCMAEYDKASR